MTDFSPDAVCAVWECDGVLGLHLPRVPLAAMCLHFLLSNSIAAAENAFLLSHIVYMQPVIHQKAKNYTIWGILVAYESKMLIM